MRGKVISGGRMALGLAISGVLGWLAARGLDWGTVREALEEVSLGLVLLSFVVFMSATCLRALRWRVLFVGERPSIARLFIVQNEGIGINNLMPVRIASEATQLAVLTLCDKLRPATALATLGMERVIDVAAGTMILGVAFFLVPEMSNFTPYIWGAIGFSVFLIGIVNFLSWSSAGLGPIRRIGALATFTVAVRDLENERARLALSLTLSILYWLLIGVSAWVAAMSTGLSLSLTAATAVILGVVFFATAIPAAPSAVGTFEFAVIYLLEYFGVAREASFGFAIVIHAVLFLPPTLVAVLFLPREGISSAVRLPGQTRATGVPSTSGT